MDEAQHTRNPSADQSGTQIQIVAAVVVGLVAAGLFWLRFCGEVDLPSAPAQKPVAESGGIKGAADDLKRLSASTSTYATRLGDDTARFGLEHPATLEGMSVAFEHRVDDKRHNLKPGKGSVTMAGLALSAVTKEGTLALRIENTLDKPVAYFIETKPEYGIQRCKRKLNLPHNAMALREAGHAEAVTVRSECKSKRNKGLRVERVEVVLLPELGFYYLSQVIPTMIGQRMAAMRGHRGSKHPARRLCKDNISASLESAIDSGAVTWFDMVDFYARHPCDKYTFPEGYKAFTSDGERPLPAVQ